MPSADAIAAFSIASMILLLLPGPAVVYIVNRSVSDGRSTALASVAGLEIGSFVHVVAASIGLSAVLATSATAFSIVKWLGAAYLLGIGVKTLLRSPTRLATTVESVSRRTALTQGVLVNTLNPKVALFFLSFLPQFIEPGRGPAWSQALVLGSIFTILGCVVDGGWALVTSCVRDVMLRGRAQAFVRRWVSGSAFVTLGVVAARAQRNAV
jgi:threonine/homoserine/homoserine lactone efflux protein